MRHFCFCILLFATVVIPISSYAIGPNYIKILRDSDDHGRDSDWVASTSFYTDSSGCMSTSNYCKLYYVWNSVFENYLASNIDQIAGSITSSNRDFRTDGANDWDFLQARSVFDCRYLVQQPWDSYVTWKTSAIDWGPYNSGGRQSNSNWYAWMKLDETKYNNYIQNENYQYWCNRDGLTWKMPLLRYKYRYVDSSTYYERQLGVYWWYTN